jgi:hypothetical protein
VRSFTISNIIPYLHDLSYPARDARFDPMLKAKRIEWSFDNAQNFTWAAVTNVTDKGIACKYLDSVFEMCHLPIEGGINAQPPALKAKARAGSTVTVQWSGIIRMHQGPYMSVGHPAMLYLLSLRRVTVPRSLEARSIAK